MSNCSPRTRQPPRQRVHAPATAVRSPRSAAGPAPTPRRRRGAAAWRRGPRSRSWRAAARASRGPPTHARPRNRCRCWPPSPEQSGRPRSSGSSTPVCCHLLGWRSLRREESRGGFEAEPARTRRVTGWKRRERLATCAARMGAAVPCLDRTGRPSPTAGLAQARRGAPRQSAHLRFFHLGRESSFRRRRAQPTTGVSHKALHAADTEGGRELTPPIRQPAVSDRRFPKRSRSCGGSCRPMRALRGWHQRLA